MSDEAETPPPEKPARIPLAELMRGPFDIKSFALTGLFVLALFYTLYFLRSVLLPIVLAWLLSYLLVPLVRELKRIKIPPLIGSALVLLGLSIAGTLLVVQVSGPAAGWIEKAPYSLHKIQEKLAAIRKPVERVSAATAELEKITATEAPGEQATKVEVKGSGVKELLFNQTPEFVAQGVLMIILLYFLLAYDGIFLGKLIKVTPRFADKKRAVTIAREIEQSISRYLVTVTLINFGLGVSIGFALWLLGMPNPILWGLMAALLNFIPYLGAAFGIFVVAIAALLSFDSTGWALLLPATYLAIATIEGNFITPMILGRSLTLNPVVIVIGLTFWGFMWGIAGAILAVPMLAAFKIFCDHVQPLGSLSELLSD